MSIFKNTKRRKYQNSIKLINENNIAALRERMKVLFVDNDDIKEIILDTMQTRKYNVFYIKDITYAIEAEPFDFIIMDIKDIAKERGASMQGLALALEIKEIYPHKIVCCYTGCSYNEIGSEIINSTLDAILTKDTDVDELCKKFDELIKKYSSKETHWNILKERLIKYNVDERDICDIKNVYLKSFDNYEYSELQGMLHQWIDDPQEIIGIITSIINIVKLLVV